MRAIDALRSVIQVLNHDDEDSRQLWNLLSGLRGPDNYNQGLKNQTTARLRHTIGILGREPNSYEIIALLPGELLGPNGTVVSADAPPAPYDAEELAIRNNAGSHFATHIRVAFEAVEYFRQEGLNLLTKS